MRYKLIGLCTLLTLMYENCAAEAAAKLSDYPLSDKAYIGPQEKTKQVKKRQSLNYELQQKILEQQSIIKEYKNKILEQQSIIKKYENKILEQQSIIEEYENSEIFYDAKGPNTVSKKEFEAWIRAVEQGDIKTIKNFIKRLDVNTKFDYKNTDLTELIYESNALIIACKYGYEDVVKLLIANGANVNLADSSGNVPLSYAAQNGNENIVNTLIRNRAKVNISNHRGITPLMNASADGHINVAMILIENGADINTKSHQGFTALDFAVTNKYPKIAKLLRDTGAKTTEYLKHKQILESNSTYGNSTTPEIITRRANEEITYYQDTSGQVTTKPASKVASSTAKTITQGIMTQMAAAAAKAASPLITSKFSEKFRNKRRSNEDKQKNSRSIKK